MDIIGYLKNSKKVKEENKKKEEDINLKEEFLEWKDFAEIKKIYDFKILAVDDDEINLGVIENYMRLENIYVDTICNPEEAMEMIEKNKYDLVLLDIMMPIISGYEVCDKIREKYSIHKLPVIMLTAKNNTDDIVKGFDCGANDYMLKPFKRDELIGRVKNLLIMKYSVEHSIEYLIKLENEKNKMMYIEKLKNFENMISITYLEKNSDKAIGIMLVIMIAAFKNLFNKISYYEYDDREFFRTKYCIYLKEVLVLEENYFLDFMKNMDLIFEKINFIKKNVKIITVDKENKNFKMINVNKIENIKNRIKDIFESDYIVVIPLKYGDIKYGSIILETDNNIINDDVKKYLTVFSENLGTYLEKQKLEKEKIENLSPKDFRCVKCNRKLFSYRSTLEYLEIKCPKCDTINKI